VKFEGAGLFYQFTTATGQLIFSGQVEGKPGDWSNGKTPLPMASASKLFTGFAAMVTMQLVPSQWYPEKYVNEFDGWKDFANFPVAGTNKTANLTIHQLLTHTSGLPFAMRSAKEDIQKMSLFYMPGTGFGYTLGHRILGWLMRDFWMKQPASARTLNGKVYNIKDANDAFRFLVFDRLGMSANTKFDDTMKTMFGMSGHAGDAAIQSTGDDLTKLAVVALRKGKLLDGHVLINETNWNAWAMKNLLPGGKQSKDLVGWEQHSASWADWNVGGMKEQIMRQSGDYGWNYFGATYFMDTRKEIGWCGFFSSCLRVSYTQNAAFVMMQRDVSDLKKSKPYVVEHFDELAKSMQCSESQQKSCPTAPKLSVGSCCALPCANCPFGHVADSAGCGAHGGFKCSDVFCQTCSTSGFFTKTTTCTDEAWSHSCPSNATRAKMLTYDQNMDELHHTCSVPFPNGCSGGAPGR
jgi:CubicO group peptidase (beta-lactamase class C family)